MQKYVYTTCVDLIKNIKRYFSIKNVQIAKQLHWTDSFSVNRESLS
jgi:hypothetical protein